MVVHFSSGDIFGIDGRVVEIEVDLIPGLKNFVVSGLAGKGIRESKERIHSAILNSGYDYPTNSRVVVNLAPAEWEKDGSAFDVAIALAIIVETEQAPGQVTGCWGLLGELGLDGTVRPVRGTLGMIDALRRCAVERVLVPVDNLAEARMVSGVAVVAARDLRQAAAVICGLQEGVTSAAPMVHPR